MKWGPERLSHLPKVTQLIIKIASATVISVIYRACVLPQFILQILSEISIIILPLEMRK